jgi:hypothetical protein
MISASYFILPVMSVPTASVFMVTMTMTMTSFIIHIHSFGMSWRHSSSSGMIMNHTRC